MSIGRADIRFCCYTPKHVQRNVQLMTQSHGDDRVSFAGVHELYMRFKNNREHINDKHHVAQAKYLIKPRSTNELHVFPKISDNFVIAIHGNGICNVQRFYLSNFAQNINGIPAFMFGILLDKPIIYKRLLRIWFGRGIVKELKNTISFFTIFLFVTKSGIGNMNWKQSIGVPNRGYKTSRRPKILFWNVKSENTAHLFMEIEW